MSSSELKTHLVTNRDQADRENTVFLCIKQFSARLGDELSLKVGDKIEVLADDSEYNDGWYMGKNMSTGAVGLYPKTFTQLLQTQTQQPGRSRSRRMNKGVEPGQSSSSINYINNSNSSFYSSNNFDSSAPSLPVNDNIRTSTPNSTLIDGNTDAIESSSNSRSNTDANISANSKLSNENQFQFHSKINTSHTSEKHSSVHKTMSDIDKALQELKGEGLSILNEDMNRESGSHRISYLDLDPRNVKQWSPEQVSSYFAYLGFEMESSGQFARHKITGAILLELELTYLKELDITSFGTRFEMFKEIEALRVASQDKDKNKANKKSIGSSFTPSDSKYDDQDNSLMPAISVQRQKTGKSPTPPSYMQNDDGKMVTKTHQRTRSQSFDDLSASIPYLATTSPLMQVSSSRTPKNRDSPSANDSMYQSQSSLDPGKKDPNNKRHSSYLSGPLSPSLYQNNVFSSFESPRKAPAKPNHPSPIADNFKFGGDNTNGVHVNKSRPASSIYFEQGAPNHKREPSDLSMNEQYRHHHRRHSSVFSFLSGNGETKKPSAIPATPSANKAYSYGTPSRIENSMDDSDILSPSRAFNDGVSSPTRRSVSVKTPGESKDKDSEKRSASDTFRFKSLKTASSQNLKILTGRGNVKTKTSAFQEGIRDITPDEAIKSADFSGWMSKKGNSTIVNWKSRYFTLHATRLSYFTSLKDKREKGLIDITAHRVLPARESEDKFAALYAASTGSGRYCFKLVPPAPGYKKGLTFTQPKTHYFAVETQEEMRGWMAALMKATIDVDDSVPVVSSCVTPTISLVKAQEMLAKAREETRLKDEELRARGYIRPGESSTSQGTQGQDSNSQSTDYSKFDGSASSSLSPNEESSITSNNSHPLRVSTNHLPSSSSNARTSHSSVTPHHSNTNRASKSTATTTPIVGPGEGFTSPYLLASGLLSPTSPRSPRSVDYFDQTVSSMNEEIPIKQNNKIGRKNSINELNDRNPNGGKREKEGFKQSIRRKSSLNFLNKKFGNDS